uniref:Kringle domain-containing protein n=1 Tax=Branchiostoma floridae TaxID=7739 RepID=C3XPB1_BRAFL|eukprot:XP_002613773.1 hypothetical protein BRAFLDRAFT_85314 [Branchiostoma floridae]
MAIGENTPSHESEHTYRKAEDVNKGYEEGHSSHNCKNPEGAYGYKVPEEVNNAYEEESSSHDYDKPEDAYKDPKEVSFAYRSKGANVALGKTAFQTSTLGDGVASRAVDGNTNTDYTAGSCTHTVGDPGETNPTWWVDLGQSYVIDRVVIFNRQDCCAKRLNPFNIHIGNSDQVSTNPKCGGDHHINLNQPSISVSCQGMKGRYVGVCLPGSSRILTLCEVQVFSGDCQVGDGSSYRGTVAVTRTGKTCQRWDSQTPHGHDRTPGNHPSSGLEQNYCRNPDGEPGVWCYTTDSSTRFEECDVPVCAKRCQNGWTEHNNHRYKLMTDCVSGSDAQLKCKQYGAHLASITSRAENDFIKGLISTSSHGVPKVRKGTKRNEKERKGTKRNEKERKGTKRNEKERKGTKRSDRNEV